MHPGKHALREEYRKKRDEHLLEDMEKWNAEISAHLLELPEFQQAVSVLFYVSMKSEVHTHELIKEALKLGAAPVHLSHIQLGPWASPDEKGFGVGPLFSDYIPLSFKSVYA